MRVMTWHDGSTHNTAREVEPGKWRIECRSKPGEKPFYVHELMTLESVQGRIAYDRNHMHERAICNRHEPVIELAETRLHDAEQWVERARKMDLAALKLREMAQAVKNATEWDESVLTIANRIAHALTEIMAIPAPAMAVVESIEEDAPTEDLSSDELAAELPDTKAELVLVGTEQVPF